MRRMTRIALAFVIMILMFSQVALAANCEFTFTANGKTYYGIHNTAEGYYQCLNRELYAIQTFNNPSDEDIAWERAWDAAKDQHHAACPYVSGGDLGDENVPMTLLYGGVVLAAISAIIVHQKRTRIQ